MSQELTFQQLMDRNAAKRNAYVAGRDAAAAENLRKAEKELAELQAKEAFAGNDVWKWFDLARAYDRFWNGPWAVAACDKVISLDPSMASAYFIKGKHLEPSAGNNATKAEWMEIYSQRVACFSKAIELDPSGPGSYKERGNVYYHWLNDMPGAAADFAKYLELVPNGSESDGVRYKLEDCKKKYGAKKLEAAVEKRKQEELRKAEAQKQNVLREREAAAGSDSNAWYQIGTEYNDLGNYAKALEAFEKVTSLEPSNHRAWNMRGRTTIDSGGKSRQAIEYLTKAIDLCPAEDKQSKGFYYASRGCQYQNVNNVDAAVANYQKSLEFDPSYTWTRDRLADLEQKCGADVIKAALDAAPARWQKEAELREREAAASDINALVEIAREYADIGIPHRLLTVSDKMISLDASYADAWEIKCIALRDMGDADQALECINKAIELCPAGDTEHFNVRGVLYQLYLNDLPKAIADYQKALEIDPNDGNATENLAAAEAELAKQNSVGGKLGKVFGGLFGKKK